MQSFFMRATKTLIRLRWCAVWLESSLGARVRFLTFFLTHLSYDYWCMLYLLKCNVNTTYSKIMLSSFKCSFKCKRGNMTYIYISFFMTYRHGWILSYARNSKRCEMFSHQLAFSNNCYDEGRWPSPGKWYLGCRYTKISFLLLYTPS